MSQSDLRSRYVLLDVVQLVFLLLGTGESRERILQAYPYLEPADLDDALTYAAWRLQEREEELVAT